MYGVVWGRWNIWCHSVCLRCLCSWEVSEKMRGGTRPSSQSVLPTPRPSRDVARALSFLLQSGVDLSILRIRLPLHPTNVEQHKLGKPKILCWRLNSSVSRNLKRFPRFTARSMRVKRSRRSERPLITLLLLCTCTASDLVRGSRVVAIPRTLVGLFAISGGPLSDSAGVTDHFVVVDR